MTRFALIDCNNFYVSCERAFQPRLENKPVVVLSNNDGCIISRSNEAKQLGVPMGAPFFKWKAFCETNQIAVFSSNYELYGDMSQRIMRLLKQDFPHMEIYSIDEAFLFLHDAKSLADLINLRKKIKQYVGIPISIGVGATKTLAKIANYVAKREMNTGFFLLDEKNLLLILQQLPVDKLWGIGRRLSVGLNKLGIITALQLYQADQKYLRTHFSVTLEKIICEIRGVSCLSLEAIQPRKQIISSRSFGKAVTELVQLEEAVSHYAAIAAEKLRKQKSVCCAVAVFMQTNVFQEGVSRFENGVTIPFVRPTADTRAIIGAAKQGIRGIYRRGYRYHKVGIILLDLMSATLKQHDMLIKEDEEKSAKLMKVVDQINRMKTKEVIFYCAEGIERQWQMRRDKCSPRYTTCWSELLQVK